jgi:four helix bundle protein
MSSDHKTLTSPNGDVKTLLTFRKAQIIYDLTFHFAHTFLSRGDRTIDQMVQAARSGKQNIAEGSAAGVTSMETAIKLTNVAKASFLELLLDYEDFLRVRNFRQWKKRFP